MELDRLNWRQFERHPLSAEYPDITGKAWERFKTNLKDNGIIKDRKVTLHEGKVLDGWQLYRACVEAGVKPTFVELNGVDPEVFVETANDLRRQESEDTIALRVAKRRERVLAKRQQGESIRTIADKEGVSKATIQNDLVELSSTVQGCTVETADGKILGKDGRSRPATQPKPPKPLCERCQRVGEVKNCQMCKELRAKPKKEKKDDKKSDKPDPVDAFGHVLPKRCRAAYCDPWLQQAYDFLTVFSEKFRHERLIDGIAKRARHYPFINASDFKDGCGFIIDYFDKLIAHLKENRPAAVCECARGWLRQCMMSGLLPRRLCPKEVAR